MSIKSTTSDIRTGNRIIDVLSIGLAILLATTMISSCKSDAKKTDESEETEVEEVFVDDPNAEETAADTSSTGVYQEESDEGDGSLQEALKNKQKPMEVEEGGMSFCDCVKKQKELSDLMMETEDDAVFDQAMADLETMKTGDCKILFSGNQNTIEGKKEHERKVKKCLGK